jgi:hypothetical protein
VNTGDCKNCPFGWYNEKTGRSLCLKCPVGTYSDSVGVSYEADCKGCSAGFYGSETARPTAAGCVACLSGFYNDEVGSSSKKNCRSCAAGYYAGLGFPNCVDCPVGTQNELQTQEACTNCVPGFFTNNLGSLKCDFCEGGRYQEDDGSIICDMCERGFYGTKLNKSAEMLFDLDVQQPGLPNRFLKKNDVLLIHAEYKAKYWEFSTEDKEYSFFIEKESVTSPIENIGHTSKVSCIGCVPGL